MESEQINDQSANKQIGEDDRMGDEGTEQSGEDEPHGTPRNERVGQGGTPMVLLGHSIGNGRVRKPP